MSSGVPVPLTAVTAASDPLFPSLPPALSMACRGEGGRGKRRKKERKLVEEDQNSQSNVTLSSPATRHRTDSTVKRQHIGVQCNVYGAAKHSTVLYSAALCAQKPARACTCSMVSQVRTPKMHGTPAIQGKRPGIQCGGWAEMNARLAHLMHGRPTS